MQMKYYSVNTIIISFNNNESVVIVEIRNFKACRLHENIIGAPKIRSNFWWSTIMLNLANIARAILDFLYSFPLSYRSSNFAIANL